MEGEARRVAPRIWARVAAGPNLEAKSTRHQAPRARVGVSAPRAVADVNVLVSAARTPNRLSLDDAMAAGGSLASPASMRRMCSWKTCGSRSRLYSGNFNAVVGCLAPLTRRPAKIGRPETWLTSTSVQPSTASFSLMGLLDCKTIWRGRAYRERDRLAAVGAFLCRCRHVVLLGPLGNFIAFGEVEGS